MFLASHDCWWDLIDLLLYLPSHCIGWTFPKYQMWCAILILSSSSSLSFNQRCLLYPSRKKFKKPNLCERLYLDIILELRYSIIRSKVKDEGSWSWSWWYSEAERYVSWHTNHDDSEYLWSKILPGEWFLRGASPHLYLWGCPEWLQWASRVSSGTSDGAQGNHQQDNEEDADDDMPVKDSGFNQKISAYKLTYLQGIFPDLQLQCLTWTWLKLVMTTPSSKSFLTSVWRIPKGFPVSPGLSRLNIRIRIQSEPTSTRSLHRRQRSWGRKRLVMVEREWWNSSSVRPSVRFKFV